MSLSEEDAIEQIAADWLALRDERELNSAEQKAYSAWLAADPRHAAATAELAAAWTTFDRLEHYPRPIHAATQPDFFARPRYFRRPVAMGLAAAAALVAAVFLWRVLPRRAERAPLAAAVPSSQLARNLSLPDSSQVKLNDDSEILEQFTPVERRVQLVRGEAQFAVAKNPARPFVVQAGPVAVRAVGTAFDVWMQSTAIVVFVTEGRVRLNAVSAASTFLYVSAGQRVVIPLTAAGARLPARVEALPPKEVERALAWETGRFIFEATPLVEVVAQFNRLNAEHLRLDDPQLGALRISGTFSRNDVDSFVQLLDLGFGVTSVRGADGEIVLRKSRGIGSDKVLPK